MRAIGHGTIVKYRSLSTRHGNPGQSAHGAFKGGVTTLIQLQYPVPERPVARWLRASRRSQLA